jgi:hypothetical protein
MRGGNSDDSSFQDRDNLTLHLQGNRAAKIMEPKWRIFREWIGTDVPGCSFDDHLIYVRYCNGTLGLAMALATISSPQLDQMEYRVR